jgi:PTS system ascorbate-specific IIB component
MEYGSTYFNRLKTDKGQVNNMKIMAICGSGLGSSFMVEMNIKKVLKKLNIQADVQHSDLSSAIPGEADLFVMAKDIAASASIPENQLVVITNIIDINELETKLIAHFEKHPVS